MPDWLRKLMFWKKEDDFSKIEGGYEPGLAGAGTGMPEFEGRQPFESVSRPAAFEEMKQYKSDDMLRKEIELISSKLDTIKATLDNMNQRLANLERVAEGEQQRVRKQW